MTEDQIVRVTSRIDKENFKKLKIKLITEGRTYTDWLAEQIKKELEASNNPTQ